MNTRSTPTAGGHFEVVVAGGGPAGAATALVLARAGRRVLLVDGPATPPGTTVRLTIGETLPPAARPLMQDLGLWPHVTGDRHLRSTGILASWGSPQLYDRSDVLDPNGHGRHLDRSRFDASLRSAAVTAGAQLRRAIVVRHHAQGRAQRILLRREGVFEELLCDWVVDATGRRCVIGRRWAVRHRQDRLVAAYTLFDHRVPHDRGADEELRTLVEAVPDGWWYTVRVPAGRLVAYLTDNDLADRALCTPPGILARAARTRHVRTRLEGYAPPVGSSRVDLQACKLEYSIVSPK